MTSSVPLLTVEADLHCIEPVTRCDQHGRQYKRPQFVYTIRKAGSKEVLATTRPRAAQSVAQFELKRWLLANNAVRQGDPKELLTPTTSKDPDADLPTLSSLRGSWPDATGGLSSVEFIRKIRDGADHPSQTSIAIARETLIQAADYLNGVGDRRFHDMASKCREAAKRLLTDSEVL